MNSAEMCFYAASFHTRNRINQVRFSALFISMKSSEFIPPLFFTCSRSYFLFFCVFTLLSMIVMVLVTMVVLNMVLEVLLLVKVMVVMVASEYDIDGAVDVDGESECDGVSDGDNGNGHEDGCGSVEGNDVAIASGCCLSWCW